MEVPRPAVPASLVPWMKPASAYEVPPRSGELSRKLCRWAQSPLEKLTVAPEMGNEYRELVPESPPPQGTCGRVGCEIKDLLQLSRGLCRRGRGAVTGKSAGFAGSGSAFLGMGRISSESLTLGWYFCFPSVIY